MNKKIYEVPKRILLIIAGIIWMITGIGLRNAGVFPDIFVAFFYTGLGCALFLAGVCFMIQFFKS